MSKYTTEVRYICENYSGLSESEGYASVNEIIENSRTKIFDFDFPIYDESYRSVLETKILKHFYTREIGCETVGLWKLWLDTRLNEIMPYYNQLYNSTLITFNPLLDTDITTNKSGTIGGNKEDNNTRTNNKNDSGNTTTTFSENASSTSNGTTETASNGSSSNSNTENKDEWKYYSDTPQGGINGLSELNYLTNATHDTANNSAAGTSTTEGSSTGEYTNENNDERTNSGTSEYSNATEENGTEQTRSTFTNTEQYIEHITGKRGAISYSKLIEEFRETFLNIDMEVIRSLDDLFLNLW